MEQLKRRSRGAFLLLGFLIVLVVWEGLGGPPQATSAPPKPDLTKQASVKSSSQSFTDDEQCWQVARRRGKIFSECGSQALKLLRGWIALKQDPDTHLFSRGKYWDYHNEAADHYSSLVLIAHYVAPELNQANGALWATMDTMKTLEDPKSGLPSEYDLNRGKAGRPARMMQLAEWLRDGLIRIVEVKGTDNPWYEEMERLVDAMLVESISRKGLYQALENNEGRGNMLQCLTRLYAMSGKPEHIEAAEALADRVLLTSDFRPEDLATFGDHGCEFLPGLAELFALEMKLNRSRATAYREPMQRLVDSVLAIGANPETGLFCASESPQNSPRIYNQPPDTWGYVLFAYADYDHATGKSRYQAAIEKPLTWMLEHRNRYADFRKTLWPRSKSSDDWSDSYESFIVLWNRYPDVGNGFEWLDWATLQHDHRRKKHDVYGPYTGGHFDGSTGRCLCMHMMLCSQGVRVQPFGAGIELGAQRVGGELLMTLNTAGPWRGHLIFDGPRTRYSYATLDWCRLNEMPQWFVVNPEREYEVNIGDEPGQVVAGSTLIAGLNVETDGRQEMRIRISPVISEPETTAAK